MRRWRKSSRHSSNTGAARIGLDVGGERQKAFLERMNLLKPLTTEIGPSAEPRIPKVWREINTATIAYGHGISVPPLRFAAAAAALVNGGWLIEPTFLPRSRDVAQMLSTRAVRPETSRAIRHMMRINVENGTGKLADAPGYDVGGKTGTAVKLVDGHYGKEVLTTFIAAFPMQEPQYVVMVTFSTNRRRPTPPVIAPRRPGTPRRWPERLSAVWLPCWECRRRRPPHLSMRPPMAWRRQVREGAARSGEFPLLRRGEGRARGEFEWPSSANSPSEIPLAQIFLQKEAAVRNFVTGAACAVPPVAPSHFALAPHQCVG